MTIPPTPLTKAYEPKSTRPLPKGKLTLYVKYDRHFIGRDEIFGEHLDYPIVIVNADIFHETSLDTKASLKGTRIGWLEGWVVQKGRMINEDYDFWQVCDTPDEELEQMATQLCDEKGEFKESVLKEVPALKDVDDIFYLRTIYLKEQYRGHGIGLLAMSHLIQSLPSFVGDAVLLSPLPMNGHSMPKRPEGTEEPTLSGKALERATERLTAYWSLLGFKKLSTKEQDEASHYPFYGLSTGIVPPDIKHVVPHLFGKNDYEEVEYHSDDDDEAIIGGKGILGGKKDESSMPLMEGLLEGSKTFSELPRSRIPTLGWKEYKSRVDKSFPPGYFMLTVDDQKIYMGKDAPLNGYPVVPLLFALRYVSELDEPDGDGPIVGMIDARLIQRGRMVNEGVEFRSACTRTMKELGDCVKALYDRQGIYRARGKEENDWECEYSGGDILYIKHVEIKKAYRGHGLSLLAISRMIDMMPSFQGDTVILPLDAANSKLKSHFSSIGFHSLMHNGPVNRKNYLGLCTAHGKAPMSKVVPKAFVRRTKAEFLRVRHYDGVDVPGMPIFGNARTDLMTSGNYARQNGQQARKRGENPMSSAFMKSMVAGIWAGF